MPDCNNVGVINESDNLTSDTLQFPIPVIVECLQVRVGFRKNDRDAIPLVSSRCERFQGEVEVADHPVEELQDRIVRVRHTPQIPNGLGFGRYRLKICGRHYSDYKNPFAFIAHAKKVMIYANFT